MTMSKLDRLTTAGVAASAQGDLAVRLLHAATPAEVVEVLLQPIPARGAPACCGRPIGHATSPAIPRSPAMPPW